MANPPQANPLTLYVPIKQDFITQEAAKAAHAGFVAAVKPALDAAQIVHYARLSLVPNTNGQGILGILIITSFDGAMNPYLQFFWGSAGLKQALADVAKLALNPPNPPPDKDFTSFQNFINNNNLNGPGDMYEAYPQTVLQIIAAFPS